MLGVKIKSKIGGRGGRINNITKYSRRHLSYFTRCPVHRAETSVPFFCGQLLPSTD